MTTYSTECLLLLVQQILKSKGYKYKRFAIFVGAKSIVETQSQLWRTMATALIAVPAMHTDVLCYDTNRILTHIWHTCRQYATLHTSRSNKATTRPATNELWWWMFYVKHLQFCNNSRRGGRRCVWNKVIKWVCVCSFIVLETYSSHTPAKSITRNNECKQT